MIAIVITFIATVGARDSGEDESTTRKAFSGHSLPQSVSTPAAGSIFTTSTISVHTIAVASAKPPTTVRSTREVRRPEGNERSAANMSTIQTAV